MNTLNINTNTSKLKTKQVYIATETISMPMKAIRHHK